MKTVVGLFDSRDEARSAITRLHEQGVRHDAISVAMKDEHDTAEVVAATGAHDLSGEGATSGLVSGAGVGVLVGLAIAGSTVLLPGIGTFLIGGPLAAALTGAGIGAVSGGLIGGLIGAGIPEEEAEHFSAGMERGHVLVAAHVGDHEVDQIRTIFDEEGSLRSYSA
jgi:hypothetical protein